MIQRNVYKEIAELYGMGEGVNFRITGECDNGWTFGIVTKVGFLFSDASTVDEISDLSPDPDTTVKILSGELGVCFVPNMKDGEPYYYVKDSKGGIQKTLYQKDETLDVLNRNNCNMFRSKELAMSQRARVIKAVFGVDFKEDESEEETPPVEDTQCCCKTCPIRGCIMHVEIEQM